MFQTRSTLLAICRLDYRRNSLAWIIAIVTRLLITGCLHEDGFADFLDGFGGGTTRERVLAIMKDSHLGTYGVIGLIAYFCIIVPTAYVFRLPANIFQMRFCLE